MRAVPEHSKPESKKAYRILMILDQPFPPDIRVENEASALAKAGFEVILLVLAPDARAPIEDYQGFTIVRRHVPPKISNWMRGLAGTIPFLSWYIARQIQQLRKQYSFDVIHAHDLYMCGGALRAGKRMGIPVVADLHEVWVSVLTRYAWSTRFPEKLFISLRRWKALEKKWTNNAKHVIVITETMRNRYVGLGCPEKKVTLLPNTINTEAFDRYPVKEDIIETHKSAYTLVYTGTINLHRGLGFLLDTMPLVLKHCPARLVIVGDGRIRPELELQAELLGIADHVVFEGWRPQEEIKSYILASDVCLIPLVKCEHTDMAAAHKLFHYMYLQRPLIATNCTHMQQMVEATDCGAVVPYGDHEAFASCLIELYKNPTRRKQMASSGHKAVLERYNWDHSVRSLVEMYCNMADKIDSNR
ncbi:MAG: glycosyltransferase family 4 protein [Bacteroidota bacterium]|nr:glycosyltransferase family 4 protein [Bacteroidota bacterium]